MTHTHTPCDLATAFTSSTDWTTLNRVQCDVVIFENKWNSILFISRELRRRRCRYTNRLIWWPKVHLLKVFHMEIFLRELFFSFFLTNLQWTYIQIVKFLALTKIHKCLSFYIVGGNNYSPLVESTSRCLFDQYSNLPRDRLVREKVIQNKSENSSDWILSGWMW